MKIAKFSLILFLAISLAACAHSTSSTREAELKDKYVYAIEREAQSRALTIYWVNPPSNEQVASLTKDKKD